ncbi:cupin domain-containing protein [Roseimicrobium sp. ORNL1]|uniref:cupin domain-containing protein n=1 Tax=Roseimicrobium sp. ORNL1 TaxID=2711231 RepID=UPI0013E1E963|nr:cupin domain-containing protein [Roseimicrobium sp. ORNL1]QIF02820.1 cupin domain-containing protein [Roseimicrobium sp. ORNL1]
MPAVSNHPLVHDISKKESWFEVLTTSDRSQVAMMRLAEGQVTGEPEDHPESDQVLLVLDGCVTGTVGEDEVTVCTGQFVVIPAGVKHQFRNHGQGEAVTFNVYAGPAYPPGTKD